MDVVVWHDLLNKLLERTLSFLSTPFLFTLCTVCRRWNDMIMWNLGSIHQSIQEYAVMHWVPQGHNNFQGRVHKSGFAHHRT